jgi:hypothetical protein
VKRRFGVLPLSVPELRDMGNFLLTLLDLELLRQATGMAGDRLARHENYAGSKVMDLLYARLVETCPSQVWLNAAQREVLGKMLMNIAYDLLRDNQDERSDAAEALAERLFQDQEE